MIPSSWQEQTVDFSGIIEDLTDEELDIETLYMSMYPSKIDLNSNISIAKQNAGVDLDINFFDDAFAEKYCR